MIKLNGIKYNIKFFLYQNGRQGLMIVDENGKDYLPATLNMDDVAINDNEIIVKNHDLNRGVLEALSEAEIITKQFKEKTLGLNKVYICKLKTN